MHDSARPERHGDYAGFATRAIAITIDLLIIGVMVSAVTLAGQLLMDAFNATELTQKLFRLILLAVGFLIPNLYTILLLMLAGQTLGKALLGLKVVGIDGGRIHLGMAIRRQIGYYISALLFLGYFWVLIDKRRQGWHDKMAKTFVVYAFPYKIQREPTDKPVDNLRQLRRTRRIAEKSTGLAKESS